jgi:hypothetical protein
MERAVVGFVTLVLSLVAALAMHERLHGGRQHPDVARCLANTATCLGHLGRMDEALSACEAALTMHQHLHAGIDHTETASTHRPRASPARAPRPATRCSRRPCAGTAEYPCRVPHCSRMAVGALPRGLADTLNPSSGRARR